ncbi:hypothetical protein Trydic_g6660 [Trypoxylus dichotomus]
MLRMGNGGALRQVNTNDYDSENGLSLNGYHMPLEIIGEILQKLNPQDLLTTRLPNIYVSEWVAARSDCGACYAMTVKILCKGDRFVEKSITHREEQWLGSAWSKKEIIIEDYPDDVETIVFEHCAQDTQFWKGHYGMKMAGAVVKVLLDNVKL